MIRARFLSNPKDPRPVNWPIKHPYWVTGYTDTNSVVVAYADDVNEIFRNWPDAKKLDATETQDYIFTSRFPQPDWFKIP